MFSRIAGSNHVSLGELPSVVPDKGAAFQILEKGHYLETGDVAAIEHVGEIPQIDESGVFVDITGRYSPW